MPSSKKYILTDIGKAYVEEQGLDNPRGNPPYEKWETLLRRLYYKPSGLTYHKLGQALYWRGNWEYYNTVESLENQGLIEEVPIDYSPE